MEETIIADGKIHVNVIIALICSELLEEQA